MRYHRECSYCQSTNDLKYIYPVAGLRLNEGLLLCQDCRKDIIIEPSGIVRSLRGEGHHRGIVGAGNRRRKVAPIVLEPDGDAT